jgi:hypothetical protein
LYKYKYKYKYIVIFIMFNYIINFFKNNQPDIQKDTQTHPHNQLFNEQYRIAYNKLWIQKIRNYYP